MSKYKCKCIFSKKLKMIERLEVNNKSKISIKIILKLVSEFNLLTKVAPKPIQYKKNRKKVVKFGGISSALKRTEIVYSAELIEMLRFLSSNGSTDQYGNVQSTKLYKILE